MIEAAAVGLALAIEEGDDVAAAAILRAHVDAFADEDVDRIVLGCTHYTFVAGLIAELAGPAVELIDPASAVAEQVRRVVSEPADCPGSVTYLTTGDTDRFAERIRGLLGEAATPRQVEI